jgi:hypothetical protein
MTGEFQYDAFLSRSAKNKAVVRPHTKAEGRRQKAEILHSAFFLHPFPCGWAQLEAGTCERGNLPFRNPLNQERRFTSERQPSALILQPFPAAPIKGSLAQFPGVNRIWVVIQCSQWN